MKLLRKVGATSEIWQVFIRDSSSTTGAGLTGLTNASSGLTAYYHRDTDTTATAISLVTMTVGTFTSSGFKEIDATNMPGWYQFCPPNAALASGAKSCAFHLKGATNMAPLPIEVDLDGQVDVTHVGGTLQTARDLGLALPAAAPNAAGGLPISAAGGLDLDEMNADIEAIQTGVAAIPTTPLLAANVPANFSALGISVGGHISNVDTLTTYTGNTPQTGDVYTRIGVAGIGLTNLGDARLAHLDADVSSRSTYAGADTSGTTTLLGRLTALRAGYLDNLSAGAVALAGSAPSWYTAPVDVSANVTAIKAKTDGMTFTVSNYLAVDIRYVHGIQITGTGQPGAEWGP